MSDTTNRLADTANRAAVFQPMSTEDERPALTVAGVLVTVCVGPAGRVRIALDLEDTEPWLIRANTQHTVGLEVSVQGEIVFET